MKQPMKALLAKYDVGDTLVSTNVDDKRSEFGEVHAARAWERINAAASHGNFKASRSSESHFLCTPLIPTLG